LADVDIEAKEVHVRSVLVDVNGVLAREYDAKTVKSRRTSALDAATSDRLAAESP
jgi:hypothetical protein